MFTPLYHILIVPLHPNPTPPSHPIPSHPSLFWFNISHSTLSYPSQFPEHSISHPLNPTATHHILLNLIPLHSTTHPSPSQFFRSIPSQHIPVYSWSYHNWLLATSPQSISNHPVSSVPPHHIPFQLLSSHLPLGQGFHFLTDKDTAVLHVTWI